MPVIKKAWIAMAILIVAVSATISAIATWGSDEVQTFTFVFAYALAVGGAIAVLLWLYAREV